MIKGVFQVLIGNELRTYYDYDNIPDEFDNVIRFEPQIPEGPHTDEEHEWIESLPQYMAELMKREQK
jgi:hypothetical protein